MPLAALGSHCLAAAGVGNAQAALELTIEAIKERSTSYTAMQMRDFQAVQLRVAWAGAEVDLARLTVAYAMERCTGGGRHAPSARRRQRHLRSVSDPASLPRPRSLAAHIGSSWDARGAPWALVALGGEFSSPTM